MERWKAAMTAIGYGMFRGCRYCNWHEIREPKTAQEIALEAMKAEDARKRDADRVSENLNALDRYAAEVLKDKEGSPDDA